MNIVISYNKMVVIVIFFLIFNLLDCAFANPEKKNCSSCIGYRSCDAAYVAIQKNDSILDEKLRRAFCGFDYNGLPMVCCADFATQTTLSDIDNHSNVRLLPDNCGYRHDDKLDQFIVGGGRVAGLYEFPWMALLSYRTRQGPQWKCGGSIINERYILTAAHCIHKQDLFGVRIGEHDVETLADCHWFSPTCETKLQDFRVEETIPHPEYQALPSIRNDIGLLRLKKPVDLSFKNAGTICLPFHKFSENRTSEKNLFGIVAGWGYTETGYVSPVLKTADVPIHTAEYCRNLYYKGTKSGEDQMTNKICSGADGKDACGGDSGGPLMLKTKNRSRLFQYGIVSYGPRVCGSNFPGIYTDVAKYMKWILDTIKP